MHSICAGDKHALVLSASAYSLIHSNHALKAEANARILRVREVGSCCQLEQARVVESNDNRVVLEHFALAVRKGILIVEEATGKDAYANAGCDSDGRGWKVAERIAACVQHEDVETAIVRVDAIRQAGVHFHTKSGRIALLLDGEIAVRVEAIAAEIRRIKYEFEKRGVARALIECAAELHVLNIAQLLKLVASEQIAACSVHIRLDVVEH